MAITLPDFTALPQLTPQATSYLPQYPANDPGASAQAKLGEGLEKLGAGVSAAGFYMDVGKTKMDRAMADADFTNRIIPINEKLKVENDPEKITELRGQYRDALNTAGNAIGDPDARRYWAAQNLKHVTTGEATADLRNSEIYNDKYKAGVVAKSADLARNAAAATDPAAFDLARSHIDELYDEAVKSGSLSATAAAQAKLKAKAELVAGRIDSLIARKQFDEAQAILDANRTDVGAAMAGHFEGTIQKHRDDATSKATAASIFGGGSGYRVGAGAAAGLIPYTPSSDILTGTGMSAEQYQTYRSHLASREAGSYGIMGGSSGKYAGRYQMGPDEIKETAARLGVPAPTQQQFLENPTLQEKFLENYTLDHHNTLMAQSAQYRNASPTEKAAILAGAHLTGVGGVGSYLNSGGKDDPKDAFGTPASSYVGSMRKAMAGAPAAPAARPGGDLVPGQVAPGSMAPDTVPGGAPALAGAAAIRITSGAHKDKYLLLPGVAADGSILTEDQALDQYEKDGKHLGIFNSSDAARSYTNRSSAPAPPGAPPPPAAAPGARPAGPQAFDVSGGDSIALSGIINGDLPGTHASDRTKPVLQGRAKTLVSDRDPGDAMAVGGRDPAGNLAYINAHPEEFAGKRVFYSTGLMNAGKTAEEARKSLPVVGQALDRLKELGATVVVVGTDKGKYNPLNRELDALASARNMPFGGALPTTDVHPGAVPMREYTRKAAQLLPGSGDTGPTPAPAGAGSDDYVTPPDAEGGDYGGGGDVAAPAPAAPGGEPAALSGGGREVRSPELITPPSATPAPPSAGGITATPPGGVGLSGAPMPAAGWEVHKDKQDMQLKVMGAGLSPEAELRAIQNINRLYEQYNSTLAPGRAALGKKLKDGRVNLENGRPFAYDPAEIRHFLPKEEAEREIQLMDDASENGQIVARVKGATADDINTMRSEFQAKLDRPGATAKDQRMFTKFEGEAKRREVEIDKATAESLSNRLWGGGPGITAAAPGTALAPQRDLNGMLVEIQRATDAGEIKQEVAKAATSELNYRFNMQQAVEHNDRTAFERKLNNGLQMTADGKPFDVDETAVRHYYPAEKADEILQKFTDAKEAGQFKTSVNNASPEDIATQRRQLNQEMNDPNATDYAGRRQRLAHFETAVAKHVKDLWEDPGGYLQTNSPLVAGKFSALLTPEARASPQAHGLAFADFAHATLAEQARLGVPEAQRTILAKGQAAATAAKLARLDPEKVDVVKELRSMALGYGAGNGSADYWPMVFGEMVKEGKLPGGYKILASMTRPDQLVAAEDLSRALSLVSQKGGLAKIKEASSPEVKLKLDETLETELADFKRSTSEQTAGANLYDEVKDTASALALFYGYKGQSQNAAVKHAVDGILRNKYEFGEIGQTTVRVPKGTLRDVERAANFAKDHLTLDELGPVPVRDPVLAKEMTPDQAKAIWMNAIQNGGWVNNGDDSGIQLAGKFRDGAIRRVERLDGTPVELRFDQVPGIIAILPRPTPIGPEGYELSPPPNIPERGRVVIGGPGAF